MSVCADFEEGGREVNFHPFVRCRIHEFVRFGSGPLSKRNRAVRIEAISFQIPADPLFPLDPCPSIAGVCLDIRLHFQKGLAQMPDGVGVIFKAEFAAQIIGAPGIKLAE